MRLLNRLRADAYWPRSSSSRPKILLLVPLVYLIVAMSSLQAAAFASEGAARQAARVFVQAETPEQGAVLAERASAVAFADFGITEGIAPLTFRCEPQPDACLTRAGKVTVTVRAAVPLPLMPAFTGLGGGEESPSRHPPPRPCRGSGNEGRATDEAP